jgi:D-alanyl-D-alanine carboxypeptidase/D-alanyl-D-alanine-endopeptidase (penicillin-binding protein 4)
MSRDDDLNPKAGSALRRGLLRPVCERGRGRRLLQCIALLVAVSGHAAAPPAAAPAVPSAASGAALPASVAQAARALGLPEGGISVWVQAVGEDGPRVAFNAETPRNPASALKLVTTFAALEGLGPDHTWATEVYLDGPLGADGATRDLWIRGGGDPFLVVEEYWKLLAALRERGLARIQGDLVFDVSRFDLPPEDRGAFDGQPDRVYNVLPHPLLVNFNAVKFRVQSRGDGTVGVSADPPLPNLRIENRLSAGGGACGGFQYGVGLSIRDPQLRDRAVLEGRFPAACREFEISRSVLQPETYAWGLFDLFWRQLGGRLDGGWRHGVMAAGTGKPFGQPFYLHRSRPLGDVIRLVNKFSNNVMTRHLEYALAVERFGAPATPEKGTRAILEVLGEHGIDTRGMVIANSAGLARETRISARQLAAVLAAGWNSPYMPEYVSSLSLVGLDGTMRSRLRGSPAVGRMHVKTGRLDGVSAVAGYVDAASGRRMLVVLLINARDAHRGLGDELQNAFLQWVYRSY